MAAGDCDTILAGIVAPWFGALPWRSLVCSGGSCLVPGASSRAYSFGVAEGMAEGATDGTLEAVALLATAAFALDAPVCC